MFIVAQFFGILLIICNILSMQMKERNKIIFMLVLANLVGAINFLLLQGYSGAAICFFAAFQTIINRIFEKKEKPVPKILIGGYIVVFIALGLVTYQSYIDILPIVCSILYTLSIIQKKEKVIRRIMLVNMILWVIYDLSCMAYAASISDSLMVISTLIGIY